MRLAKESMAQEEAASATDYEIGDGDDDKTYAAMNIAKTIGTVCVALDPTSSFHSYMKSGRFLY